MPDGQAHAKLARYLVVGVTTNCFALGVYCVVLVWLGLATLFSFLLRRIWVVQARAAPPAMRT